MKTNIDDWTRHEMEPVRLGELLTAIGSIVFMAVIAWYAITI